MLIPCPDCGHRPMAEFTYGGAALGRPADPLPEGTPDAAWDDHVYLRDNPAGPHAELWFHAAACRTWFRLVRDTRDNSMIGHGI